MENKIKEFNLENIEKRKGFIASELEKDLTLEQINDYSKEVEMLEAREKEINESIEKRNKLIEDVKNLGNEKVIEKREEEKSNMKNYNLESKEYRSAFFKNLLDEEMTQEERAAFTEVTSSFGGAMPKTVSKEIVSLIEEEYAILGDIDAYQVPTVLEFTVHKSIKAGDAKVVVEAKGNVDEENDWDKVSLNGKHFSKHVEISYDLSTMNANDLDGYLQREIATRLGLALNKDVVTQVLKDMEEDNKIVAASDKITYKEILKAFSLVNGKNKKVYVSNADLYTQLASLTDDAGHLIFQPSFNDGVEGRLLGAEVKLDETVEGILIGDPKQVKGNYVIPVTLERDRDIKRGVNIFAGHTRFECALVKPNAFANLTVDSGE